VPAFIDEGAYLPMEANGECLLQLAAALHGKAHSRSALCKRGAGADHGYA